MDLGRLSNLLVNVGSPHEFLVQEFKNPVVYHYTDLNALRGIVTDHDLWLTNSAFLNDYDEGAHGRRVVREALDMRSAQQALAPEQQEFARVIRRRLDEAGEQGVYVCCFCLEDDLLGQWRSYAANGTGVSLGFGTSPFQSIAGPDIPLESIGLIYLWRVFYDLTTQRKIVDDCLQIAWGLGGGSVEERIDLAVDALRFFVPTFKNADFSDEREARLIFQPSRSCGVKPTFRVGRGMLVPYYKVTEIAKTAGHPNWRPPLTSIRIGPSPHRDVNRRSVGLLLEKMEYLNVNVDVSNTPYRG